MFTSRSRAAMMMAIPGLLLLAPVFLVLGLMHLFAAGVRLLSRVWEPRFLSWRELIAYDPQLGWKPRPGIAAHYLADRDDVFRLVTDGEGWPGTRTIDDSDVIVVGDSFAFGYGVDTERSFAHVKRGPAIKGIGCPGYSMVHSVLLMEHLSSRLAGKVVIWFICLENDLEDNLAPSLLQYRSPFVRPSGSGEWEVVTSHLSPEPWHASKWSGRLLPHLCAPGPIAERTYAGADYLVKRAAQQCRAINAQLALVTIPHLPQLTVEGRAMLAAEAPERFDATLPEQRLGESCRRHGVVFVPGSAHLSADDYKANEGVHWNERGHRRMAKVLHDLYESLRSGPVNSPVPEVEGRPDAMPSLQESAAGMR
jgi:hypothetical protein